MNDNYQSLYYCKKDRMSEMVCRLVITTTDSLTSQARAFIGVNVCTLRVSELNCVTKKEKKMKREQLNYIYLMSMHFPRRGPWLVGYKPSAFYTYGMVKATHTCCIHKVLLFIMKSYINCTRYLTTTAICTTRVVAASDQSVCNHLNFQSLLFT